MTTAAPRMKLAIIGSGISGLGALHLLAPHHDVTVYEAAERLGGHTHTHTVERWGQTFAVDSGFIVHNPENYPLFTRLLAQLGVNSRPTTMSFAVSNARTGLEYNATSLDTLFCQRRNLVSPRFLGMLADLARFYREAPAVLARADMRSVGEFLEAGRYGDAFRDEHLAPMASALWSCPSGQALEMPVAFLVRFMANHHMLSFTGRPTWRVVEGGSHSYVKAILACVSGTSAVIHTSTPALRITRDDTGVTVTSHLGDARFDHVIIACHADQALSLLADPSPVERKLLSALPFVANDVALHHDQRLLPRHPKATAAWNALVPEDPSEPCTVSYGMHLLQGIHSPEPFIVTLNRSDSVDPDKLIARMRYDHPVFTKEGVAAAERLSKLDEGRFTHFAGAYLGFGFHEDGFRSAVNVAARLGVTFT
jgi:predicted NAD/FAD-binding protein